MNIYDLLVKVTGYSFSILVMFNLQLKLVFFIIALYSANIYLRLYCMLLFCHRKATDWCHQIFKYNIATLYFLIIPPLPEAGGGYTVLPLSVLPSVQDIFRRIFLYNCWWQKSDIWSQALYRYTILWVAFLDPSDSYFLFADFVDFSTHWTYMLIFRRIFLSNYWWQKSDIGSQASYRYPI